MSVKYSKDKKLRMTLRMSEKTMNKLADLEAAYEENGCEVIRSLIDQKWSLLSKE